MGKMKRLRLKCLPLGSILRADCVARLVSGLRIPIAGGAFLTGLLPHPTRGPLGPFYVITSCETTKFVNPPSELRPDCSSEMNVCR